MRALRRLGRFTLVMFRPQIYVTYGVLWVLALEGAGVRLATGHWQPSATTVGRVVSVVLVLLFMRMLDEQKDLDYDRVHNPDRPLVTGAITVTELRATMIVIAVALVGLNGMLSVVSLVLIVADLGYGLFLAGLEHWSTRIRDNLIGNLLVTYPVQLLLSGYIYLSLPTAPQWSGVPLVLVFACVFLHFEFARKTRWHGQENARLYSVVLGPRRSALTALTLAFLAVAMQLALFEPWTQQGPTSILGWLPVVVLAVPLVGATRFLARATESWPISAATGFVLGSYLSLIALAAY